ncbi:MAG TPA: pectate lyase [Micromonosporaceae bacterium]|nr:pectate lyase [Micromonosporaceae bacterium]
MRPSPRWRAALIASATTIVLAAVLVTRADAATLFSDDFSDGNASGWSTSGGSWSASSLEYRQSSTGADAKAQAGMTSWSNYTVQARVRPIAFGNSTRSAGIVARAQNMTNFYSLVLVASGSLQLRRISGGGVTTLATAATGVTPGTTYTLALAVNGSSLSGSVNGTQLVSASDGSFGTGRIGLVASYTSVAFDDVTVFTGPGPDPTPTVSASVSPTPTPTTSPPPPGQADGFASVNALGQNGTTGGAGGPTVTATTAAQLQTYVGQAGALNILVSGTIQLGGMITVVANKSIIGVGSTAQITGGGLQLGSTTRPGNNVIIRNIKFSGSGDDSISVTNSAHHVWIDHNEFLPVADGSLDIKRQSTFVTVSWNKFSGTDKSMLLGHSDSFTADIGYLKVSYHHNFFDGSNQRHPRVRFGEPVHVYNNYYRNVGLYGVVSVENAGVMVEGNYFENVAFPCYSVSGYADSGPGRLVQRNNIFAGSGVCEAGGSVAEPNTYYGYTLSPAAQVPALVQAGAGVGKL